MEPGPTSSSNDSPVPPTFRVEHFRTIAIWAFTLAIVGWLFAPLKTILLGFLATAAIASALHPLLRWVPGPRALRAVIVGLLPPLVIIGVGFGLYALLRGPITEQVGRLPEAHASIDRTLANWSGQLGLAEPVKLGDVAKSASQMVTGGGGGGSGLFAGLTHFLGGMVLALAFILFGGIYLLADDNERTLVRPLQRLLPPHRREPFAAALRDIVPRLRWWLIGAMFSMIATGIASALGYWLVGLNMGIALGVLTGVSEIIPTLGPASTFGLGLLAAAGDGGKVVAGVVGVYAFVQVLESYVLQPLVMRKAVEMPPIVTLFSVVLWGQIFGAPGLILAIPINIVIWAFVQRMVIEADTTVAVAT